MNCRPRDDGSGLGGGPNKFSLYLQGNVYTVNLNSREIDDFTEYCYELDMAKRFMDCIKNSACPFMYEKAFVDMRQDTISTTVCDNDATYGDGLHADKDHPW